MALSLDTRNQEAKHESIIFPSAPRTQLINTYYFIQHRFAKLMFQVLTQSCSLESCLKTRFSCTSAKASCFCLYVHLYTFLYHPFCYQVLSITGLDLRLYFSPRCTMNFTRIFTDVASLQSPKVKKSVWHDLI